MPPNARSISQLTLSVLVASLLLTLTCTHVKAGEWVGPSEGIPVASLLEHDSGVSDLEPGLISDLMPKIIRSRSGALLAIYVPPVLISSPVLPPSRASPAR
ncbi:MAG: hypothetical protein CMI01_14710 [Oceanospirillaceae bacterium]|uniref:hypothetical protein n=1 Tax=Marinobacterium litorale TaxID=404770 RepID=UPI000481BA40|nr:hypothetical protein [Marinobacterium litorale]MBS99915.1 hypothetical protein [Oceanospirillaceae bacterium]